MNAILIKILATGLALAQVATRPDAVKTEFDPIRDKAEVVQLLRDGCMHIRKAFDIEAINLDDLIATAMDDPKAVDGPIESLRGLKFDDLFATYRQFCNDSSVDQAPIDVRELISFYNETLVDLPDHSKLKEQTAFGLTVILDQRGKSFAEIGDPNRRREWVPLSEVPDFVQKAFVAAEDKRFLQHNGIDERGMIRALVGNLAEPGRLQGGSTISQQVAKNLLVGGGVTFERKLRELIVASRIERSFTKSEILELYLNAIYFGRGAWGIGLAARNYFDKSAKDLSLVEGALLAALIKGPTYFDPDRYPERVRGRLNYVLDRMLEDGTLTSEQRQQTSAQRASLVMYSPPRRDSGFYFVDHLSQEAKDIVGIDSLAQSPYEVHSTVHPNLQRAAEIALQEGLSRYERQSRRVQFEGPEANLSDAIRRIEAEQSSGENQEFIEARGEVQSEMREPAWLLALKQARLPLYDVHWSPAVIVEASSRARDGGIRVGLTDGQIVSLNVLHSGIRASLKLHDVVFVHVDDKSKARGQVELRVRPSVQGAALVLDNETGKILAMAGGFSYPLSQLNRATQAWRQPGSALKPITYLAALKAGMQPRSPVLDTPITLAPIEGSTDYWTPKNYSGRGSGRITLQQALEQSRNLATVRLLDGGITNDPKESLERVCEIAVAASLYEKCELLYPFVLGAQPLRIVDLAAFYAAIVNGGTRPSPYAIESIEQNGKVIYRHESSPASTGASDAARFYQLKTMLQGVVARGTARSIRALAPYVAGKTGTSNDAADAWFVGFSNDVTVAVWVGYDNADGERRDLGDEATGNRIAAPIFESIMQAVWTDYAPRTILALPPPEVQLQIARLETGPSPTKFIGQRSRPSQVKARATKVQGVLATQSGEQGSQWRRNVRPTDANSFYDNIWGDRLH